MKIAVVGAGLMGSAATRHLAKAGVDVTLIGPAEPENKRRHQGTFGSHYDEGRITRHNALKPFWVEVSKASIARYAEIEAESGLSFFTEAGALYARTVAFFEVSAAEAARLKSMPALVYEAPEDPYLLPPIRYPDGKIYIKLGGDPEDVRLDGPGAVGDWFRAGGDAQVRDRARNAVMNWVAVARPWYWTIWERRYERNWIYWPRPDGRRDGAMPAKMWPQPDCDGQYFAHQCGGRRGPGCHGGGHCA